MRRSIYDWLVFAGVSFGQSLLILTTSGCMSIGIGPSKDPKLASRPPVQNETIANEESAISVPARNPAAVSKKTGPKNPFNSESRTGFIIRFEKGEVSVSLNDYSLPIPPFTAVVQTISAFHEAGGALGSGFQLTLESSTPFHVPANDGDSYTTLTLTLPVKMSYLVLNLRKGDTVSFSKGPNDTLFIN